MHQWKAFNSGAYHNIVIEASPRSSSCFDLDHWIWQLKLLPKFSKHFLSHPSKNGDRWHIFSKTYKISWVSVVKHCLDRSFPLKSSENCGLCSHSSSFVFPSSLLAQDKYQAPLPKYFHSRRLTPCWAPASSGRRTSVIGHAEQLHKRTAGCPARPCRCRCQSWLEASRTEKW